MFSSATESENMDSYQLFMFSVSRSAGMRVRDFFISKLSRSAQFL